jgi:hypothetical protein
VRFCDAGEKVGVRFCDAGEKVMGLVLDAGKKLTVKTLTFVIRKI